MIVSFYTPYRAFETSAGPGGCDRASARRSHASGSSERSAFDRNGVIITKSDVGVT
jgi:hypothetical protein